MPDRPPHGGYPRNQTVVDRARRLAPQGGKVERLGERTAYIELRDARGSTGGLITADLCPDDRTMTASWAHLDTVLQHRGRSTA